MPYQRHEHRRLFTSDYSILKMSTVVVIVLLACFTHVDGYPTGPPVTSNPEICSTMTPGHGYSSQTSTPPYLISVRGQYTPYCYVRGQPVTVTISGIGGATFSGFFTEARLPSSSGYGVFANNGDANATPLGCFGQLNNVIGHNNEDDKTSVSFTWTPPSSLTGTITLITTIVQDFSTYWVQGVTLSFADCDLTALQPETVTPGGGITFSTQGTSYLNGVLFGSSVQSRPNIVIGSTQATKAYLNGDVRLPDSQLLKYYFYVADRTQVAVIDSASRRIRLQVWRPYNEAQAQWQLVWQQAVSIYPNYVNALYGYSLTNASTSFVAQSGDRIGLAFEGSVGVVPFTYVATQHTYQQKDPVTSLPTVGQVTQFDTMSLPTENSAAILVRTSYVPTTVASGGSGVTSTTSSRPTITSTTTSAASGVTSAVEVSTIDCGDHFQCATGNQCVAFIYRCNGIDDCDDGSDEAECMCRIRDQYQCSSGQCIDRSLLCTGHYDCWDGTDEQDCPRECGAQFRCQIGTCVPYIYRCNGVNDCKDASDEHDCICPSLSHHFQCASGNCIDRWKVCNGVEDCADWSDERNCPCHNDQFHCSSGGCISSTLRCNGIPDCTDFSDETNCVCSPDQFTCAISRSQCIPSCKVCDGQVDCSDLSDETNCSCPSDWFRCANGQCVSPCKRCNVLLDCIDGSDELSCDSSGYACSSTDFWCLNGERCVKPCARCDGQFDCRDKTDEFNCECTANQFRCSNGQCVSSVLRCDNVYDCDDNSDETGCPAMNVSSSVCSPIARNLTNSTGTITSPYYPDNYVKNANCQWRIISLAVNKVVTITFDYVSTELFADFIVLYDGYSPSAPVIAVLSGPGFVGAAYRSTQRYMYIAFTSNSLKTYRGFSANYTTIGTPTACDASLRPLILTDDSGTITSPYYPSNYFNQADCQWRIASRINSTIHLMFSSFYTEPQYDLVNVYDGLNSSAPLIAALSGGVSPMTIYSSSQRYMYIKFTSDRTNAFSGFTATYTVPSIPPACIPSSRPMYLNSSVGYIMSPLYPTSYPNNADCQWRFMSPDTNGVVTITFDYFSTEMFSDSVMLYDGYGPSAPVIATLSGPGFVGTAYRSTQRYMYIAFTSNSLTTYRGFSATYASIGTPAACDASLRPLILIDDSGNLTSPYYPKNYFNQADCRWRIASRINSTIRLMFSSFNTEPQYDLVNVYDGFNSSAPLIANLSGVLSPMTTYTSSQRYMYIKFTSDRNTAFSGFTATYTVWSIQPACSASTRPANLTLTSGILTSPYFPNTSPSNTECRWLIAAQSTTQVIQLKIITINLGSAYLYAYDGSSELSPNLMTLTSVLVDVISLLSSQRYMFVQFTSNGATLYHGFNATYASINAPVEPACSASSRPLSLTGNDGVLVSPNFPSYYSNNADCQWLVMSPSDDMVVSLNFILFNLYDGDYVYIYDGNNTSATLLGSLSGYQERSYYVSTQRFMLVRFTSNARDNGPGFEAMYTAIVVSPTDIAACTASSRPVTITDSTGILRSPYYPRYQSNANCQWLIVSTSTAVLIDFGLFVTGLDDNVRIYDGMNTASSLIVSLSGVLHPSPQGYMTTQRFMLITFSSGTSLTAVESFTLTYFATNTTDCPPLRLTCLSPRQCLTSGMRCDGICDCTSCSDEHNCTCDAHQFYCSANDRCIPLCSQCNGSCDCSDCADENGCITNTPDTNAPSVCSSTDQNLTATSGSLSSPNYPNPYPDNADCRWRIVASSETITLSFDTFSTESCCDRVTLYDGFNMSARTLATLSGSNSSSSSFTSTQRYMYVTFTSDGSLTYGGFSARYTTTRAPSLQSTSSPSPLSAPSTTSTTITPSNNGNCSSIALNFTGSQGTFTSPNYPGNYNNNADCSWRIVATSVTGAISLSFDTFNTEACCDRVTLYDGFNSSASSLATLAGSTVSASSLYTSTQRYMYVTFTSDGSLTYGGFSARYTTTRAPSLQSTSSSSPLSAPSTTSTMSTPSNGGTCSSITRNITESQGTFTSPNYPGNYINNADCSWRLVATAVTGVVTISFDTFSTESCCDRVNLYDGFNSSARLLVTLSGSTVSPSSLYTSTQRYMYVTFTSDFSAVQRGFIARYTSTGAAPSGPDMFACYLTGRSIRLCQRCDGVCDCTDCSDEVNCTCNARQWKCQTSDRCLPTSYRCDGQCQCPDCSDERSCPCATENYRCLSTDQCLPQSYRCDGIVQCLHGEDELGCSGVCAADERHCRNGWCLLTKALCQANSTRIGLSCTPTQFLCDGYSDCPDGSDEMNCTMSTTLPPMMPLTTTTRQPVVTPSCTSPGQYLCGNGFCLSVKTPCTAAWCRSYNFRCDGYVDCGDGSDERQCSANTTSLCRPGQFTCNDKRSCLSHYLWCDGIVQCLDGSDEFNCTCPHSNQYQCANGQCIYSYQRCNGYPDCRDGTDELMCGCSPEQFKCNNGDCVTVLSRCQGDHYCTDYSDQINCTCGFNQFQCRDSFACISRCKVCDGVEDCSDGSDETMCNSPCSASSQFSCASGQCVAVCKRCDRILNCDDGSDEMNCSCPPTQFRCVSDGTCISNCQVCDGGMQCSDASDEANCAPLVVTPFSVVRGVRLNFLGQGASYDGGQLFGNNVTRRAQDLHTIRIHGTSWIDADNALPSGYLTKFFLFLAAGNNTSSRNAKIWLEIWRPYNVRQFQWQLVWHQQFDGSTQLDSLYTFNVNRFAVQSGDHIGWRYEGDAGRIPFDFNDKKHVLFILTQTQTPRIGQTIQFGRVSIGAEFSIAVLIDTNWGAYTTTPSYWFTTETQTAAIVNDGVSTTMPVSYPPWTSTTTAGNSPCGVNGFQCSSSPNCISSTLRCDGICDCLDCSDENNCDCIVGQFQCQSTRRCLPLFYHCDSVCQCPDCSDEISCSCRSTTGLMCNNGRCYLRTDKCDGINNCGDYTDEVNCNTCTSNQSRCAIGLCINSTQWCDGVVDCPDGSDERSNCRQPCSGGMFTCSNGRCIPYNQKCNGVNDCGDVSDEVDCNCTNISSFRCQMGLCLPVNTWCDGYTDCPDNSDELPGCNTTCPTIGSRRCAPLQTCIAVSSVCDTIQDCPDDSDEVNCPCNPFQYHCINDRCIDVTWLCDGIKDCPLGDDEQSCNNTCLPSQFRCQRGTCISADQQCDGLVQCPDASDESNCLTLNTSTNQLSVSYRGGYQFLVCAEGWTSIFSDSVCKQLGYTSSATTSTVYIGVGNNTKWLRPAPSISKNASLLQSLSAGNCPSSSAVTMTCVVNEIVCGRRSANITNFGPYIVNGQWAQRGAWPWQVMILLDGRFLCGGSLINDRWILTAAHCTVDEYSGVTMRASQYTIRLGSIYRNGTDADLVVSSVDLVFTHPLYDSTMTTRDVGLLRLSRSVTFTDTIRPICLPAFNANLNIFKVCVSTGFGRTKAGSLPSQLLQARMVIRPMSACYSWISEVDNTNFNLYNETVLCLGPQPTTDVGTCNGDSGGPFACQDQQGTWTVVGVTSFGFGYCDASFDAHVPSMVDWIQQTIDSIRSLTN